MHGAIDRRGFLDKAARYAVGGVTAAMLLDQLSPKFAEAAGRQADDARIKAQFVEYASPKGSGTMRGYLVQPAKAAGKLPGVLVIHENRGLNPHIEDIARRLALDDFVAFAPDALFPLGGYPGDEDKARDAVPEARPGEDARGLRGGRRLAEGPARVHRQASAPSASATAAASSTCWRRGCPTSRPASPFYGSAAEPSRTCRRSRRRS